MEKELLYKNVGNRIRKARESCALTQEDLARRISLTRTSVTNIEKGRQTISLYKFFEIAGALNISPSNLLPNTNEFQMVDLEKELPKNLTKQVKDRILSIVKLTDNK
jgi:transcriptional regulator with XRE-family HTH domain